MNTPRLQILVFVLVVAGIYGSLHAYLWWKLTRQLRLHGVAAALLALFLLAMVIAPFLGRLLPDGSTALRIGELATFIWMGFSFYLFLLNLGADLWNLVVRVGRLVAPTLQLPTVGGPWLFRSVAVLALLIVVYAGVEASAIRLRCVRIPTTKLPPGAGEVRIVQVSDIHLGLLVGERRLAKILRLVREARPDLVVATGDVLDAVGDHLEPLADAWRKVTPRWGKFAVTGNHEHYAGLAGALRFLEGAGFQVLREKSAVIPGTMNIIGKDFPARRGIGVPPAPARPLAELVHEAAPGLFTLLLMHTPTGFVEEAAPLGVDLQLSGHTHDGQLFPFRFIVRRLFPFSAGLYREGKSLLYVSRGTGTWGPPLRFLAPPEVTVFSLVPEEQQSGR